MAEYTVLGRLRHFERCWDTAIVVRGGLTPRVYFVSYKMIADSPPGMFEEATHVPAGLREWMIAVPPPFYQDVEPVGEDWPPALGWSSAPPARRIEFNTLMVGKQWWLRCGYDGPTDTWYVSGEPQEVEYAIPSRR